MADDEKKTAPTTEETSTAPAADPGVAEEGKPAVEDKPAAEGATTTNGASAPAANTSTTPAPVSAPLVALPDESTEDSVVRLQSSADLKPDESR